MATEVTDSTFETEVLQSGEPVLVDFWAEWCGPCHAVAPVLERIAEERSLKLVKVNIDENQDLALKYGIQSIPNMMLFENGQTKGPPALATKLALVGLEKAQERRVLREEVLDFGDAGAGPVLQPALGEVVLDAME